VLERLLKLLEPFSMLVARKLRLAEKLNSGRWNVQYKLMLINGEDRDFTLSRMFAARLVSVFMLGLAGTAAVFAAAGGDPYAGLAALLVACFLPFAILLKLERKLADRKKQIMLEFPELLNKLLLLVNAGETIQSAMIRCAERFESSGANGPLAAEFVKMANRLRNSEPFHQAMETFSRRCAVPEVSVFTATVLMNYRRGGEMFVTAMRSLNRELWEKRKAMARTLGEEASSKLVLPMLIIFLAVMGIVAAPAAMLLE
jgi:tight adherence protein C